MKKLQKRLNKFLDMTHPNMGKECLSGLYSRLIDEEYKEFLDENSGTPEDMKEVCDLLWVLIQYANCCGYALEKGMHELCKEYESKFYRQDGTFEPLFRDDGKLLKNTGFRKANFNKFFEALESEEAI